MRRTGNVRDKSLEIAKGRRKEKGQWKSERGMQPYEDEAAAFSMKQERSEDVLEDLDQYLI
jgi:hypothetical protein